MGKRNSEAGEIILSDKDLFISVAMVVVCVIFLSLGMWSGRTEIRNKMAYLCDNNAQIEINGVIYNCEVDKGLN